jgi:DNA-directed RNA polymerase specialized sigma subunit
MLNNRPILNNLKEQMEQAKRQMQRKLKPKNEYEDKDMVLWHQHKNGNKQATWDLLHRFEGMIAGHASTHSNVNAKSVVEAQLKQMTLKAFDTYDPNAGAKLSTHVMNNFKKLSRLNIQNQQAIRLPENIALKYAKHTEAESYLTEVFGRKPTSLEIAEYLGWGVDDVENAAKRFHKELVESKQVYDPGVVDSDIAGSAFRNAYHSMTDHEKHIVDHTLGPRGPHNKPEMSAQQIMRDLSMTPYQFNKVKNNAIDKVQQALHVLQREE